jgi:hypothetical protein
MANTKLLPELRALTRNADSVEKEHAKQLRKVLSKLKTRQIELA